MKAIKFILTVFIVSIIVFAPGSSKSENNSKEYGLQKEQIRKKIETVRLLQMVNSLELDEEQALKINAIMKKYDDQQTEMRRNKRKHIYQLRKELQKSSPNRKKVQLHSQEIQKIESQIPVLRQKETDEISMHLNEVQQGKYLLFRQDFKKNVREILHKSENEKR